MPPALMSFACVPDEILIFANECSSGICSRASQVYMLAWAMIEELSHPFEADSDDRYNFDAWLSSTEGSLFASLRSSFDRPLIASEFAGKA